MDGTEAERRLAAAGENLERLRDILGDEVDSGFPFGAFGRDGLYELRGVRYADLSVEQRLQLFASGQ